MGRVLSYTYDSMNRVSSKKRPTGGETQYAYDTTGGLAKEKMPTIIAPTVSMTFMVV